jgi:hypothetical protein
MHLIRQQGDLLVRLASARKVAVLSEDAELVGRALARDGTAFRAIMKQHNRRLYRIARSILRNDSDADDAVQEAYLNAFAHLDRFRGDSSRLARSMALCGDFRAHARARNH